MNKGDMNELNGLKIDPELNAGRDFHRVMDLLWANRGMRLSQGITKDEMAHYTEIAMKEIIDIVFPGWDKTKQ